MFPGETLSTIRNSDNPSSAIGHVFEVANGWTKKRKGFAAYAETL